MRKKSCQVRLSRFVSMLIYYVSLFPGAFRQYDFGMLINLSKYGSFRPPDYDLSAITVPVALFYGNNDWLVSGKVCTLS